MLPRALLFACLLGVSHCQLNLTILHNNDIHAHFDPVSASTGTCRQPGSCFGGIGRLVHAVKSFKQAVPNTLVLYGGDVFQGHLYYTLFKWRVVADMVNLVPYDAMALGNHEFDDGLDGLLPYMENVTHPLLCTNIDFGPRADDVTRRCLSSIVQPIGGVQVGIMGYTTPKTAEVSNVPSGVTFEDEIVALQAETRRLQAAGVGIIIATGHSGYAREKQMAEQIDGVDVIVGGHSHSLLYTGSAPDGNPVDGPYPTVVRQASGRTVLVVQAYQYGKYLGMLNVTFDAAGEVQAWAGNPVVLDGEKDAVAEEHLAPYITAVLDQQAAVVAETRVRLVGERSECRVRECNLGNLIADGMVRSVLGMTPGSGEWSKASAAIVNSGGIRESVDSGNITQADIMSIHPFGNTVDVVLVTGRTLWKVFEHSVSGVEAMEGRFLQVSGLRVTFDLTHPVGSRVRQLEIVCTNCTVPEMLPVKPNQQYRVVLPTFVAKGGDGYRIIMEEILERNNIGVLDTDALLAQVTRLSPVITGIEGRLLFQLGCCRPCSLGKLRGNSGAHSRKLD